MKPNAKSQAQKENSTVSFLTDNTKIPFAGKLTIKQAQPDYSSMNAAVEKISDPVNFDDLKKFYGMD